MSSEVASESTWKPLPGSNRVLSRSSSDEELHQSLLDASDGSEQPRRRSSIQGQHMPQIRVPMRARLEQVWPKLRLLNKLLLPIGALLAAAGGGCAWALNGCRGIDSWLLESGGVIVGLPLLLDIFYLAALAPYAIFMSQANRDPLSCGPRRFVFPNDSAVPAVCSVGGLLSATVLSFGLACPLVSDQVCGERLTPWLRWLGALGTSACAYVLICLLYGDKGAIATLWVISVIMGSVGGACLDNTLAGVVDCHNALGWSLASIGFTLAYAIPLVLLSLWSRKCWPFVLSAGFLVFGIVVGATGAACVGDLLVGVAACDPAAGWALAAAGAATGGLPLLVVIVGIFYQTPYLIGEHGAQPLRSSPCCCSCVAHNIPPPPRFSCSCPCGSSSCFCPSCPSCSSFWPFSFCPLLSLV